MERQVVGGRRPESAIQELLRGQEFTCQLKLLLTVDSNQSFLARKGGCAQDLVGKILSTFTHTISLLNTIAANVESSDVVSGLSLAGPRKSDSSTAETSSKKRKTAATSQESWVKESPTMDDDGYAWRKYGQKTILNSDFSRHYYRCTYKLDHNCPATKQVQLIQARPNPIYRTTYSAHHTCTNNGHFRTLLHGSSHHGQNFVVDDSSNRNIISFSNCKNSITPFLTSFAASSSAPPVVKQQQTSSSSELGEDDYDYDMFSSLIVDGGFDQELSAATFHDQEDCNSSSAFMRMLMMHSGDDLGGFLL